MKKKLIALGLLALPFLGFNQLNYSSVKIYASNAELAELANLGVTIDHGQHKPNQWFITDLSSLEIDILSTNGYPYEVLIEDAASYYAEHAYDAPKSDREECEGLGGETGFNPEVPENFHTGSMGGYFTYEEFLAELDEMRAAYPDLITEKEGIHDFETWEGRPIHWVRISDNPEVDEDEKEVFYSAIHHAREPMSLSQTIFYMWYLLENYGTNDEVTFLVDNTEMYFVPMINPDGYKYNQTTNPSGGGMHRKNRNPSIGTSNKGVDLNRNYDYHWDEAGTDAFENGDTFAGEGPFSEPETQAIKWFCENHNFEFAFNSHSYGNLLLFPFGWSTGAFADDHDYYLEYSSHQAQFNGYTAQKSSALYAAAGDSDDWMYDGDLDSHDAIFAITPEVGTAFWPAAADIIPTCQDMVFPNLVLGHLPHVYGFATDLEASSVSIPSDYFNYTIKRLGIEDGDLTVSMTAIAGIESLGDENVHTLEISEFEEDSISYTLNPGLTFGDEIIYVLSVDNGTWTRNDTITKTFGDFITVFSDDCSDLENWTGDWDYTSETYYSPSRCITDSPFDDTYGNNVDKKITLSQSFTFEDATYALATFRAKWEIENDYDYVQFMASTDGGSSWTPLCGNYTNIGVANQEEGEDEPLYDAAQTTWVLEEVNLEDYIGEDDVTFRFVLITDGGLQMDGFYFDDFSIATDANQDGETGAGIETFNEKNINIYPNPTSTNLNIVTKGDIQIKHITIFNELGETVYSNNVNNALPSINVTDLAEGIYFVELLNNSNSTIVKRFTVIK